MINLGRPNVDGFEEDLYLWLIIIPNDMASSAIPAKMKVQTASNEFLRRFRNTSREVKQVKLESVIEAYVCDQSFGSKKLYFPQSRDIVSRSKTK